MPDPDLPRERFDALFREHHPAVRAYARRRVPREVVDDIVSETFLVVWRRLDDVPDPPLPWLRTVPRNVAGTEGGGAGGGRLPRLLHATRAKGDPEGTPTGPRTPNGWPPPAPPTRCSPRGYRRTQAWTPNRRCDCSRPSSIARPRPGAPAVDARR